MPKISEEQKRKFLELYKQGHRGRFIGEALGISKSYAKGIIHSFDSGDFSWMECSFRHHERKYSEEKKVEIVEEILASKETFHEHVAKHGAPETLLRQWIRNYTVYGVCTRRRGRPRKDGSNDKRAEENQRVREREYYLENVLPSLCGKRDGSSKKKILRTVGKCRKLGIPLQECLRGLKISSSTYHYWKKHENDCGSKDGQLASAIKAIQESVRWSYGAKRMAKALVSKGVVGSINHKKVARIMAANGLNAKIRRRRFPKNYYLTLRENSEQLPRNILSREFNVDQPNMKLVTDITYLPTKEGWLYLAAVMDLYNREIVSYRTSRHMSLNLVTTVVNQMTKSGANLNGTLIHSDMGWTYTNREYVECLKGLGAVQSMSRKGNCWDNACMENFFGLFKSETIRQMPKSRLLSVDEMNELVDDYMHWYNNERIQKKLGYLSPVDYRKRTT